MVGDGADLLVLDGDKIDDDGDGDELASKACAHTTALDLGRLEFVRLIEHELTVAVAAAGRIPALDGMRDGRKLPGLRCIVKAQQLRQLGADGVEHRLRMFGEDDLQVGPAVLVRIDRRADLACYGADALADEGGEARTHAGGFWADGDFPARDLADG